VNLLSLLAGLIFGAATTAGSVLVMRRVAIALGFVDRPRPDRFHTTAVPLLGGIACIAGIAASAVAWERLFQAQGWQGQVSGHLFAAAVTGTFGLLLLGLVDDRRNLRPLLKAVLQGIVLAAVLVLWRPDGNLSGPFRSALAWLAAMVLINAWNYLDHADGIFAGVAAVASAALALAWGAFVGEARALGLLWGLCGASLGFLLWNAPPARIFLGDAGSLPLGFLLVLASLAIIDHAAPGGYAAAIAVHFIPVTDMALVSLARIRARRSPFRGGRDHSAHRLSALFGQGGALVLLVLIAALFAGVGLFLGPKHPRTTVGLLLLSSLAFLGGLLGRKPPPPARPPVVPGGR